MGYAVGSETGWKVTKANELDVFLSKPFTFIVQGKTFYVHASLISRCSAPLDKTITGSLREAQQGFAMLEDVTEATFARFVHWLYHADYTDAQPTIVAENEDAVTQFNGWKPAQDSNPFQSEAKQTTYMNKATSVEECMRQIFAEWEGAQTSWTSQPSFRPNQNPLEDYTEVFLAHARVYVFAEKDSAKLRKKQRYQVNVDALYLDGDEDNR